MASGYDERLGISLAYLEKALFCGGDRFNRWDVGDSMVYGPVVDPSRLRFVSSFVTQAAAGVGRMTRPGGCFVAFRGTHGGMEIFLDAMFMLSDFDRPSCPGCKIDLGFSESYESLRLSLFDALDEFGCQQSPLYLVGHSLGAAMMQYFLYDIVEKGYHVRAAYALESPRPGNDVFAKKLLSKLRGIDAWRTSHYKDVAVHYPESFLYKHVFPEVYYSSHNGTAYNHCDQEILNGVAQEDPQCSNQWRPWQMGMWDHCWYAGMNPCFCENDTHMPRNELASFRSSVGVECLETFAVPFESASGRPGAATCGQRMAWLRSPEGGGHDVSSAMAEVARLHPGRCGACTPSAFDQFRESRAPALAQTFAGLVFIAVFGFFFCVIVRKRTRRMRNGYVEQIDGDDQAEAALSAQE